MSQSLREYARSILQEGIYDTGTLKAVFIAGDPEAKFSKRRFGGF